MVYTVGSPAYNRACERAADEIRANLAVGAVAEYLDGDSALEYLGEIVKIHQRAGSITADQVDSEVGIYLQTLVDKIVDSNMYRVAEENQS